MTAAAKGNGGSSGIQAADVVVAKGTALRTLFHTLRKARRMVRLYPAGNKVREDTVGEFADRARAALGAGSITMRVKDRTLVVDGQVAYEEPENEDMLRQLLASGIKALRLEPAVTDGDLRRFVDVLATEAVSKESEEDVVSRLWEANLSGVKLAVIDEDQSLLSEQEHNEILDLLQSQLDQSHLGSLLANLETKPARELPALVASALQKELVANLPLQTARLVLADLGAAPGDPQHRQRSVAALQQLLRTMIAQLDPRTAVWLLDEADRCPHLTAADRQALSTAAVQFGDAAWLQRCFRTQAPETIQGIGPFLIRIGGRAAAELLSCPGLLQHGTLRQTLESLAAVDPEPFHAQLGAADATARSAAMEVLLAAGGRLPPAMLRQMIGGPDAALRLLVLRRAAAYLPTELLATSLRTETHSEAFLAACAGVNRRNGAAVLPALADVVNGKSFAQRPLRERQAAFEALGNSGADTALDILAGVLAESGFLRNAVREENQTLAAKALATCGNDDARALLESFARHGNRHVRETCNALLRH